MLLTFFYRKNMDICQINMGSDGVVLFSLLQVQTDLTWPET